MKILEFFLENYNDGRRKNFYCIAVNLLSLDALKDAVETVKKEDAIPDTDLKRKIKRIAAILEEKARQKHIELKLRKK